MSTEKKRVSMGGKGYPLIGVDFGYQAKVDKPHGKPPTGGSAVKKPPSSEQKTKN
jgi:hypothetical protein